MNSLFRSKGRLLSAVSLVRSEFKNVFSYADEETKKRITVPQKMLKTLEKRRAKNMTASRPKHGRFRGQVIVTCNRPQFNHHSGQTYSSFSPKDLASGGWKHDKSRGDHFTINAVHGNPALLSPDGEPQLATFESFNFHKELINGLKSQNITKPTNIQALTIPALQEGQNVLCAAETGSGKTLAFLLPMIERVHQYRSVYGPKRGPNRPLGVVLTPSRELADQIYAVAKDLACHTEFVPDVKCGGRRTQILLRNDVEAPVDILITTPGVFSKLLSNKVYDLSRLSQIVLDEADTLLDDSFSSLTLRILQKLKISSEKPVLQQTRPSSDDSSEYGAVQLALVGATLPRSLESIMGEVVPIETIQRVTTKHLHRLMPHVAQKFVRVGLSQRPEYFLTQLKSNFERKIPTIVFCNKTATSCFLGHFLDSSNIPHIVLHSNMPQKVREGRFEQFQNGDYDVLICTDIVSRGLDTKRARHIINYEFPDFISDYIHRVGRVGRVGSSGSCFVLSYICHKWDVDLLWQIETSARKSKEFHNVNANIKRKLITMKPQDSDLDSQASTLIEE